MRINPEVKRHFWLEFSLHRAIIMPVILGVIFLIAYMTSSANKFAIQPQYYAGLQAVAITAETLFGIIIFYWGSYRASGAIVEEINANTWDYQRLSSLSAWSLGWGTIVGSTLYVWYGALICLTVFSAAAFLIVPLSTITYTLSVYLISGMSCIALVTLVGMQALQTTRRYNRKRMIGFRILGPVYWLKHP